MQYAASVMERFPQHQDVQRRGCYALGWLCNASYHNHAIKELAGEAGAVEAVVHALDSFAASDRSLHDCGVDALRNMTAGHAANAAKLEAAGGTHYLQRP